MVRGCKPSHSTYLRTEPYIFSRRLLKLIKLISRPLFSTSTDRIYFLVQIYDAIRSIYTRMKNPNYYESLPKKRMSVSAIFLNQEKHILIVKPTYRAYWLLPGGCIEEDESPQKACIRETKEELNIDVPVERLISIDYLAKDNEETECLQFIFYGGILSQIQIYTITLPETELSSYCFLPVEKILPILSPKLARGLPYYLQALKENTVAYLEDGHKPH